MVRATKVNTPVVKSSPGDPHRGGLRRHGLRPRLPRPGEGAESFQGWYPKTFENRSTESALEAAHAFDGGPFGPEYLVRTMESSTHKVTQSP